ncbi:hypothetical protein DOY81_008891 [Sarcophaga bullata]|nr:hypothetical protein DOY81_008891 [Sarcophaga bullata]
MENKKMFWRSFCFNKPSKQKTGGGPYQEMILTSAEEQIIQATGVDLHVEGLSSVKTFGKPHLPNASELDSSITESIGSILKPRSYNTFNFTH